MRRCEERMRAVSFDVGVYVGRAGMLRVVDDASGPWGHISVDYFTFDWERDGGGQVTKEATPPPPPPPPPAVRNTLLP